MIFNYYSHFIVKLGDSERYEFHLKSLMFTEMLAIEEATGLAFDEWRWELGRGSIRATAGLLHILRKRAGVPSDFQTLNFNAFDLECAPLHDDGTEFTRAEVVADITGRAEEAKNPPTGAAAEAPATASTSPSSPASTESAPGSGTGSPGVTSTSSAATPTPS